MAEIMPFLKKKADGTFQFHIRNKNIRKVPIKNLLDVGCCAGHMLRMYHNLMHPEKSFGFEPSHKNYLGAANRCPFAQIENVAVSDYDGKANLNIYETKSRHSLLTRTPSVTKVVQPTKVMRLDTWARENGIKTLDFVKIDTQGLDFNVIKGMGKLITTVKIIIVEIMFDDREYEGVPPYYRIFQYLEGKGLKLHSFRDVYHEFDGSTIAVDGVFMNEEALSIV